MTAEGPLLSRISKADTYLPLRLATAVVQTFQVLQQDSTMNGNTQSSEMRFEAFYDHMHINSAALHSMECSLQL